MYNSHPKSNMQQTQHVMQIALGQLYFGQQYVPQTNHQNLSVCGVQPNQGFITPQSNQGFITPQSNQGFITPQSNQGFITPQSNQGFITPQSNQGFITPQSNQGFITPQSNQGFITPKSNQGFITPQNNHGFNIHHSDNHAFNTPQPSNQGFMNSYCQQQTPNYGVNQKMQSNNNIYAPIPQSQNPMRDMIATYADNTFIKYDYNRSGYLDVKEIYNPVCEMFQAMGSQVPSYPQVLMIMQRLDNDKNGLIDINEFRRLLLLLNGMPA